MSYLRKKINLPLILGAGGTGIPKWWIYESFAVHPNMRGHTSGRINMVRGFPVVTSTNQKLNNQRFTESEIVRVDECMPAVCWTRYLLEIYM